MNKHALLVACIICMRLSAHSQPTLTAATSNPVIGDIYYDHYCHTAGVVLPASGAGISWNYSTLVDSVIDSMLIVPCASTPYCDSFVEGGDFVMMAPQLGTYYSFAANSSHLAMQDNYDPNLTYIYSLRPDVYLKYPLSYGNSWRDTDYFLIPSNYQHTFSAEIHTATGYGTLTTPSGTYHDVMLVHNTNYVSDTQFNSGSAYIEFGRLDRFFWYVAGYHNPILYIQADVDSLSGSLLNIEDAYYSKPSPSLGVAATELVDADISVFPNPSRDILHISSSNYQFQKEDNISLFDITGRQLPINAEGISGNNSELVTQVSQLSSGIYVLRIQTSFGTITRKVEVVN